MVIPFHSHLKVHYPMKGHMERLPRVERDNLGTENWNFVPHMAEDIQVALEDIQVVLEGIQFELGDILVEIHHLMGMETDQAGLDMASWT